VILNMPGFFKSIFKASMALMPASLKDKVAICPQSDTANCGRDVTACPFFQRFDGTAVNVPRFLGGTAGSQFACFTVTNVRVLTYC